MTTPTKRLPMLPVERALKVIAGRWKAIILYQLFDGPKRLSALRRLMPEISRKMLSEQLREMETHGVVRRDVQSGIPARVDYTATPLGFSLEPLLVALCEWGLHHAVALDELDRLADCPLVAAARTQRAAKFEENRDEVTEANAALKSKRKTPQNDGDPVRDVNVRKPI